MKEILEKYMASKDLVGLRMNYSDSNLFIGFVSTVTEEYVTIDEIDRAGRVDGSSVLQIDDIDRIEVGDSYQLGLLELYKNPQEASPLKLNLKGVHNLFFETAVELMHKQVFVKLFFSDTYFTGLIKEVNKEVLCLEDIPNGQKDGLIYFKVDQISGIEYGGTDTIRAEMAYKALSR